MIKIIKDISKEYYSLEEYIIVKDLESYFEARSKFFKKYKENEKFQIVIKNKKYFSLFLDFEQYESVKVEEIYEVKGPKVNLGPKDNLFRVLLNALNYSNNSKKIIEILEKQYFTEVKFLLNEKNRTIENYLELLTNIVIFSKYKEHNFNILLDEVATLELYELGKTNLNLQKSFSYEREELKNYISKCDKKLREDSKKMSLFNEFPEERYFGEINGILPFEKEYFLKRNIEKMNQLKGYDIILINLEKAEIFFNESYLDIKNIVKALIKIDKNRRQDKVTIQDFQEFFMEIYLNYNSLSSEKNLESLIENIEKKYRVNLFSLKQSIKNIWSEANKKFEEFYLKNYSLLYSSSEQRGLDYAIENSYNTLNNNKNNLYIFIDCLRYDIWLGIKKYMQQKGFNCHLDKVILSGIPTVTSYCKKILYTGKKYNQIESKDFFKSDVVKIISMDDLKEESTKENVLYEILDLDNFFHNIKDLTEEYLQNTIELKLNKLLDNIEKDIFNIIIMTDHGAMRLYDDNLSSFRYKDILTERGLQVENHGRYIKVFSNIYDDGIYNELDTLFEKDNSFYTLNREAMPKYYLPLSEKEKENYFYLIYKYGKYPKKTGEFNHGGISFEEVLIPYGVFKTEEKEFIPVKLEIKSTEIKNDSKAEVDILIKNSNVIQNLKVNLKYQNFTKEYKEVEGNKLIQIPLELKENLEGEYRDIAEIEFYFEGEKHSFKETLVLKIIKNQRLAMNKKLKSSRSLL